MSVPLTPYDRHSARVYAMTRTWSVDDLERLHVPIMESLLEEASMLEGMGMLGSADRMRCEAAAWKWAFEAANAEEEARSAAAH
jgi:hypothetical protein